MKAKIIAQEYQGWKVEKYIMIKDYTSWFLINL